MSIKKDDLGYLQFVSEITFTEEFYAFKTEEFYQNGKNIYIGEGFKDLVLSSAEEISLRAVPSIKSFNLIKSAKDKQIRTGLPKDYIFENAGLFCVQLGLLLTSKKSELISSGHANLFYVRGEGIDVIAVDIRQYFGTKVWYVRAFPATDTWWHDGLRVFSANL